MAFAYTNDNRPLSLGNARMRTGTFTNAAGDTGGAITTGLNGIFAAGTEVNSHVGTQAVKYTRSNGTLTIVTGENVDGQWWAIGV